MADNVVIPGVPPIPSVNVELVKLVTPPVPLKAVFKSNELVLDSVTPVTVTEDIVKFPVNVWLFVSNVYTPVPGVNVPVERVIPPRKVRGEFPELLKDDPAPAVNNPTKIFVPVELEIVKSPLVPLPIEVVPFIVVDNPPMFNVVPFKTDKFPATVNEFVPARVAVPATVVKDAQLAATFTVTIIPEFIETVSAAVGTGCPPQVAMASQFPETDATRWAYTLTTSSITARKVINTFLKLVAKILVGWL